MEDPAPRPNPSEAAEADLVAKLDAMELEPPATPAMSGDAPPERADGVAVRAGVADASEAIGGQSGAAADGGVPVDPDAAADYRIEAPHAEAEDDSAPGEGDGEGDGDGGPLDLPDEIGSMGHGDLARLDLGDDDAYGQRRDISWMRVEKANADLHVEASLVINALRR